MAVPFAFANLSGNIALSKLDSNFNTPITIGNTSVQLGGTITTLNNMTLSNVTISGGTNNVTETLANVTTLNATSAFITTGNISTANVGNLTLLNALTVPNGGTGMVSLPANNVLLGNGTSPVASIAPGTVGNVLTSTGTGWVSNAVPIGGGGVSSVGATSPLNSSGGATPNISLTGLVLVPNGGTGLANIPAGNIIIGNGTSALYGVAPGTAGNVLTSIGGVWTSNAAVGGGNAGVSSISFGSTGLTPNTATGGAVTVAGTLVAGNGGTGLSAPGTAGNVLTSNGTIWTSAAPSGGGAITFISTLTASTSSTIDFTGLSGYSKYLIIFENVLASASGTLSLRFGTGATPTYLTSSYGFQYSGVTPGSSTNSDRITLVSSLAANSAPGMSGSLFVEGMLSGKTSVQGLFYYTDVSSGSQYSSLVSSGTNYSSTVAKTALRFLPNSGNIGSGTFSLYGITS